MNSEWNWKLYSDFCAAKRWIIYDALRALRRALAAKLCKRKFKRHLLSLNKSFEQKLCSSLFRVKFKVKSMALEFRCLNDSCWRALDVINHSSRSGEAEIDDEGSQSHSTSRRVDINYCVDKQSRFSLETAKQSVYLVSLNLHQWKMSIPWHIQQLSPFIGFAFLYLHASSAEIPSSLTDKRNLLKAI